MGGKRLYHTAFVHAGITVGALFLLNLKGCQSFSCYACDENKDPANCQNPPKDVPKELMTCKENVVTCVISTGLRNRTNKETGVSSYVPIMTRRCSRDYEGKDDLTAFNADAKGQPMICYILNRLTFVDRRCVCITEKCNSKIWDELMVLPTFKEPRTEGDTPQIQPLGNMSLDKVAEAAAAWTPPPDATTPGPITPSPDMTTANENMTISDNANATTDASGDTKAANAGGGSNAGLIAGLAVGGLCLAGLAGGLLWWFKFRKPKKKKKSGDSGGSDNSGETDASGGDDDD